MFKRNRAFCSSCRVTSFIKFQRYLIINSITFKDNFGLSPAIYLIQFFNNQPLIWSCHPLIWGCHPLIWGCHPLIWIWIWRSGAPEAFCSAPLFTSHFVRLTMHFNFLSNNKLLFNQLSVYWILNSRKAIIVNCERNIR